MMLPGEYFSQSFMQLQFNFGFAMRVLGIKPSLNRHRLPAPVPTTDGSGGRYHLTSKIAHDAEAEEAFKSKFSPPMFVLWYFLT